MYQRRPRTVTDFKLKHTEQDVAFISLRLPEGTLSL
jgi:hypothetical protein